MYDVIIIGAGITGTMTALACSHYCLKTAILEKENDVADGATMANSAIIHTGYDPADGTMKARMNVRGASLYKQLCADLGCTYRTVGAYVAACGETQEKVQDVLADRAARRGIRFEWLSGNEARSVERNLSDDVTRVLSFPDTAIIYPWEVAIAATETAMENGVELHLNSPCLSIEKITGGYRVRTEDNVYETRTIVNAAGIYADRVARMTGYDPGFEIRPRKGEYFVIDAAVDYVKHVIFPVPSAKGKGVLAVPTVYGNTLIGPNSDYMTGTVDTGNTFQGLDYIRGAIRNTMKNVPLNQTIRTFAGLRPSSSSDDFVIEEMKGAEGFINVASIESPGLASAPAIAEYVISLLGRRLELTENDKAVMTRKRPMTMRDLSEEEKAEVIKKNPLYAKIICRCEQISEGEIVDCIHRPCGARSVKGVKKRVRPGMGRCQGGFCEPRVVSILARELGIPETEVVLDGKASKILEKENR